MSIGCDTRPFDFLDKVQPCRSKNDEWDCSRSEPVEGVAAAVSHYIEHYRVKAAGELEYFGRELRSDKDAVSRAALAQLPSGKRQPHQRRILQKSLEESRRRLLTNLPALRRATSFDDLFDLVDATIRPIAGIGELTVYDTALRIGARFGLEPTRVYLHAGARAGAEILGFDRRRQTIEMHELPAALRGLSAREVEDLLCIYKSWLS